MGAGKPAPSIIHKKKNKKRLDIYWFLFVRSNMISDKLKENIKEVLPLVVDEWNNVKLPAFESLIEKSFKDYFEGRQTQEKTKMVAPILETIFERMLKKLEPTFVADEGKGHDYLYGDIPIECKITCSDSGTWTGNGYAKTPIHILMSFKLEDDGNITDMFCMFANLTDDIESGWGKKTSLTANFVGLRLLSEDIDNFDVVVGEVSTKNKLLKVVRDGSYNNKFFL